MAVFCNNNILMLAPRIGMISVTIILTIVTKDYLKHLCFERSPVGEDLLLVLELIATKGDSISYTES